MPERTVYSGESISDDGKTTYKDFVTEEIVDPANCGCTDCITGYSHSARSMDERIATENGQRVKITTRVVKVIEEL